PCPRRGRTPRTPPEWSRSPSLSPSMCLARAVRIALCPARHGVALGVGQGPVRARAENTRDRLIGYRGRFLRQPQRRHTLAPKGIHGVGSGAMTPIVRSTWARFTSLAAANLLLLVNSGSGLAQGPKASFLAPPRTIADISAI